ncbi:DUF3086 domain-containing protein [Limnofasciculus baicalensis]|uniref:DUF3086 domain-containing protein n=1 Tax=Limnofasciculus baicalensis BBK-W-15 TaxID=2699891 RepID=A0AAE3GQE4_9CYAN|nr:DUF3086 domain-containing protein [Limnofasciculus baicalensis]MCP2728614.1 DUF3086 domain-containing protein [Limnofasciculus baicalensis BBK-W-15]
MNSDESQTHEEEQAQQPPTEALEKTPQDIPPVALADLGLQTESTIDELPQEIAGVGLVESGTVVSEMLPLEQLSILTASAEPVEDNERLNELAKTVGELERQEQELRQKLADLQVTQSQILAEQLGETQTAIAKIVQEGLKELEQRKQELLIAVEQLERRRERIRTEMRTTFAGVSQELAIRVQGFKDYLVGSLQDLAATAEQLELATPREPLKPIPEKIQLPDTNITPKFTEQKFQEQVRQIRSIIDQYRKMPDYYGPPWQLRRTFEPIHAERVGNWFFNQGGRGALRTMGSRMQNILVASATISVLRTLYGDRLRTLILANTPERLGEWRRGLQDCLGISRSDFGPENGVTLFEESPALVQKADRLVNQKQLPLIIIDETEDKISLSLLQFPLWLAFAPDPQQQSNYDY